MKIKTKSLLLLPLIFASHSGYADQVILDDLIVDGSACVGQDCSNGESFGFDTLRLKENNLRIKFEDTSTSASFPSNDWQLTANDSTNGGQNRFSIDDTTNNKTPFTVEGNSPNHALYIDSSGNVGLGTSTPVVEMHIKDGDTPTMRLEQDGSSGFTPQTWDVAGNETNFFVRDATNGSKLPFKIKPGAPDNSLFVASSGNVGLNTTSPASKLHVDGDAVITSDSSIALKVASDSGGVNFQLDGGNSGNFWNITAQDDASGGFVINNNDGPGDTEFTLDADGNITITGALTTTGAACNVTPCDGVFKPEVYQVESIEEHAKFMWEKKHLWGVGPTSKDEPFNVSQKTAGILHELEKAHVYIEQLNARLGALEKALSEK